MFLLIREIAVAESHVPNSITTAPALLAFAAIFAGLLARWRYWYYPEDMKRSDGSPDPRAGAFAWAKAVTDLLLCPLLLVIVLAALNFNTRTIVIVTLAGGAAFLGSGVALAGMEKISGAAFAAAADRIKKLIGG